MSNRVWNGRTVKLDMPEGRFGAPKAVKILLEEKAARTLALALARLKQMAPLPGDVQELLNALDYVMVGDPNSVREHRRMEAGKGMTPDGGHKAPAVTGHEFWPVQDQIHGEFACGWTENMMAPRCGRPKEDHAR